jgi:hypothetical protein
MPEIVENSFFDSGLCASAAFSVVDSHLSFSFLRGDGLDDDLLDDFAIDRGEWIGDF